MDKVITEIIKLHAFYKKISNYYETIVRFCDPPIVLEYFKQYNNIKEKLKSEFPDILSDFQDIATPKSSGTTDNDGRGYIEKDNIELLLLDINEMLDILIKYQTSLSKNSTLNEKNTSPDVKTLISMYSTKEIWNEIEASYGCNKRAFGKKINFATDQFKRKIIFRDIEHAYILEQNGFSKPALILAGGVIEELLRLYLQHKSVTPEDNTFNEYIKSCESNSLLKSGISELSNSVRHFRNIVHLEKEISTKDTISKSAAKGAVSSIFTIINDF